MDLDDRRWDMVDHALSANVRLSELLQRVASMPTWDDAGPPNPALVTPWNEIQVAVFDDGNVREAAYVVLPYLLRLAQGRPNPADLGAVIVFALAIVFGALEGAADIPPEYFSEFDGALRNMRGPALHRLRSKERGVGSRRVAAAAVALSEGDMVAGRIADELAWSTSIGVQCGECNESVEVVWEGAWRARSSGQAIRTARTGRFDRLVALAAEGDLGTEYSKMGELSGSVACPNCGVWRGIPALLAAEICKRSPLARAPGWLPYAG